MIGCFDDIDTVVVLSPTLWILVALVEKTIPSEDTGGQVSRTRFPCTEESISRLPEVHHLEFHARELHHVAGLKCIRIDVVHFMRMEDAWFLATEDDLLSRRVREAICSPITTIGCVAFAGRAHDGYAFSQHHLIAGMRVKVSTAHETCLSWVRVYPPQNHQVF